MASEAEYWRRVASYFADCLAASAAQLSCNKRLSHVERDRQISICKSAVGYLTEVQDPGSKARQIDAVVDRLKNARRCLEAEDPRIAVLRQPVQTPGNQ